MPARKKEVSPSPVASFFNTYYNPLLVILLVIAAFFLGMFYTKVQYLEHGSFSSVLGTTTSTTPPPAAPTTPPKVNVATGHFPAMGNPNAKIKIIEFADFRCPFCERLYKEVEPQIINDYVKTGKAVFYFRHFAFLGDASVVAANAAECANEQNKFWEMHNYFYDNQPSETDTSMYTVDNLTQIAGTLGMDTTQFSTCLSSNKYQANVDKDYADGQAAGVSATPAMFINGQLVIGAQPYSEFKKVLDAAAK